MQTLEIPKAKRKRYTRQVPRPIMLPQFIQDLMIPGCILQIGTKDQVIAFLKEPRDFLQELQFFEDEDLYFLGGVAEAKGKSRASDEDIFAKNYFYFDIDIRKNTPDISDTEIKYLVETDFLPRLKGSKFSNWRYLTFTGNGVHVYFFSEKPKLLKDKDAWKIGLSLLVEQFQELFPGDLIDPSCINAARIARLPGSLNHKSNPPKLAEILQFQDVYSNFIDVMEENGQRELTRMAEENRKKSTELQVSFPDGADLYKRINALPIKDVVCRGMGWSSDGKYFYAAGSSRKSACFISARDNFLVHGGTSHLPPNKGGYSPFDFIRTAVCESDSRRTFLWFEKMYPELIPKDTLPKREDNIDSVFKKFQTASFDKLSISPELDPYKLVIRGALTRIGAMSHTGKSSMAYYLVHRLIKNGYRGIMFSTEIPSEIVLANLLKIELRAKSIWEVFDKRDEIDLSIMEGFSRLSIYDVTGTENSLKKVEEIIQEETRRHPEDPPLFVAVDYCQMMTPKHDTGNEFSNARRYAYESQRLAQVYKLGFICLSQLNREGIQDMNEKHGVIPFENGPGPLYAAADIAVMLKRDRSKSSSSSQTSFDIRKHKYLSPLPDSLTLDYDYHGGTFSISKATQAFTTSFQY